MSKDTYRSQFRLPWDLHELLKAASEESGRSLNAELVTRLEDSFREREPTQAQLAPEMRKAELLLDFEEWLLDPESSKDEKGSFRKYCLLYNGADPDGEQVDFVSEIDEIHPAYLHALALAWRRYARESKYVQKYGDPTRPQRLATERRKGELVLGYMEWCEYWGRDPFSSDALDTFCKTYNTEGVAQAHGKILEIPEISPGYLEELLKIWIHEVPFRLKETIGSNRFILESFRSLYKQQSIKLDDIQQAIAELAKKLPE